MILYLVFGLLLKQCSCKAVKTEGSDGPLYLTPFIESNRLEEGRKLAQVTGLGWKEKSYAGLLTVDKQYDSNIFFWYFPSERRPDKVPLLVWLNGFSTPSTYGLLLQNGPYDLAHSSRLTPRKASWTKYFNVVYIDNPVGVGFSFTRSDEGFSRTYKQISDNLFSALSQFLRLFPKLRKHELYLTGLSLGGMYTSALAYRIYNETSINFKGIFLGNPYVDAKYQFNYGDYLYQLGFVDKKQEAEIDEAEKQLLSEFWARRFQEAYKDTVNFLLADRSFIVNVTGLSNVYNYAQPYINTTNYDEFIRQDNVSRALHVSGVTYDDGTKAMKLVASFFASHGAVWLQQMLDRIRMMFYVGQTDVAVPYPVFEYTLEAMNWTGKKGYAEAERVRLYDEDTSTYVWGYLKNYKTLTNVMVRDAGHSVVYDQPERTLRLLLNFTEYSRF